MSKDEIIEEPVYCKYDPYSLDYEWLVCKCPDCLSYGWRFKKSNTTRFVDYICDKCNTKIGGLISGKNKCVIF